MGDVEVAEVDAHQEAIDLRLGQREGAGEFNRVLRRQYQEGKRERVGGAIDRHLLLLHRFQKGRLRLGGGPVDLIGEQDLREDRTLAEFELLGRGAVDIDPRDIRRKQVRRELQPLEAATQRAGERLRQHGLAHAGHVLDEDVAAAQQCNDAEFDLRRFADEHTADVVDDPGTERLDRSVVHLHPVTSFSMIRFRRQRRRLPIERALPSFRYLAVRRRTRPAARPPIVPPLRASTASMTRTRVSRPAEPSGPTGPMAAASSATTMKPTATMMPFQVAPPIGPTNPARNPPASSAPKMRSPWETSWLRRVRKSSVPPTSRITTASTSPSPAANQ